MSGALDPAALQRALEAVAQQHEALRTAVCVQDGHAVQSVVPANALRLTLPFYDFSDLNPHVARTRTRLAMEEAARQPFDLCSTPLLRAGLYREGYRQHVLHVLVPVFAADAFSLRILAREIMELYAQISQGRRGVLPLPAVQHPDFAVWQRGVDYRGAVGQMLEHLAGAPAWLRAGGFSRAGVERASGTPWRAVQESLELPGRLIVALRALAAAEDVTLETVLLAGFAALLYSRSGQADMLIGLPVGGRWRSDLAGSVGAYADYAVLRAQLGAAGNFRACLAQIQQSLQVTRSFGNLPLGRLLSAARLPRDMWTTPLFQVVFGLDEGEPELTMTAGELRCKAAVLEGSGAVFDLALHMVRSESAADGLTARLTCRARLFDVESAAGFLADYRGVLELVAADVDAPLEALAGTERLGAAGVGEIPRVIPAAVATVEQNPPQAARTAMEAAMAELWEDVLNLPGLPGVESSFFDLGGDSLRAVYLLERIRSGWQQKLPLTLFFQNPTVAGLAAALHERLAVHGSVLIPLQPDGESLPFFCVVMPDKLPALAALARALGAGRPVYALQDSGAKAGEKGAAAAAARFEAALRAVQPQAPYLLGGIGEGGAAALELARRFQTAGDKVALLALVDSQAPPAPSLHWLRRLFRAALPRPAVYTGATLLLRSKPRALLAGDAALGWGRVSAAVDIRSVPIARADLLAETHAPLLAAILRPALDAAGG